MRHCKETVIKEKNTGFEEGVEEGVTDDWDILEGPYGGSEGITGLSVKRDVMSARNLWKNQWCNVHYRERREVSYLFLPL